MLLLLSHVWPFATPWTVTRHAPCDSPGKNTGVGCHVLQGISRTQGANATLLHWKADSAPLGHQGSPSSFLLAVCFTRGSVYVSATLLISSILSFPCCVHKSILSSASLFLPFKQVHSIIFPDSVIYVLIYNICFCYFWLHSINTLWLNNWLTMPIMALTAQRDSHKVAGDSHL